MQTTYQKSSLQLLSPSFIFVDNEIPYAHFFFFQFCFLFPPYVTFPSARQSRKATLGPSEPRAMNLRVDFRRGTARCRPQRPGRIQTPAQNLPHGGDQVDSRVRWRTRGLEFLEEVHVLGHCFLGTNQSLRPHNLIFDGLSAQPANPMPLIPLSDALYVGRRALLRQTTALAFRELDFRLRNQFHRCCLTFWCCYHNWVAHDCCRHSQITLQIPKTKLNIDISKTR